MDDNDTLILHIHRYDFRINIVNEENFVKHFCLVGRLMIQVMFESKGLSNGLWIFLGPLSENSRIVAPSHRVQ